jgi:predicted dehydrogenase
LFKAIAEDTEFSPNFNDGYQIELIADAILESAQKGEWVKLEKTVAAVK